MKKDVFCPKCFNKKELIQIKENETFEIRGEKYQTKVTKYICEKCDEKIIDDEEYDKKALKAYNQYRKKHNLLLPKEIKDLRKIYDLSQRALSRLLGWGEITIHRYENGRLQDEAHDQVLKLLRNPKNMEEILQENKNKIKPKLYKKIKTKINELIKKRNIMDNSLIEKLKIIDKKYTGGKTFDFNKFSNIILYFSQNIPTLWKTKLLKLIWYSEFLNYKNTSKSISGVAFSHWDLGPVPKHFYGLFDIMAENLNLIDIQEYTEIYCGEIIKNLQQFNKDIFTKDELDTLENVLTKFENYTSSELVEKTHEEVAYKETNEKELIPYVYAKELNIN